MTGIVAGGNGGYADDVDDQGIAQWPDWPLDRRAAAQLARYVSVAYAAREVPTNLRVALRRDALTSERLERVRQLYYSLAARRIPYSTAPWNPATYNSEGKAAFQRIRTPLETIEGPATCLDLVLTFSGMAIEAGLRPLIAIRYNVSPHALIALDLSWSGDSLAEYGSVPGFRLREPGVWDGSEEATGALATLAGTPGWKLVDVVRVTESDPDFVGASRREMATEHELADTAWTLIDVRRVLADLSGYGIDPFNPPLGRSVPPIHGYLPAMPEFRQFSSRRTVLHRLENRIRGDQPATVVLCAPSGYGKSMLAHRLAVGADNGCGWFLNATDAKELCRSLAQAERGEHELAGERPRPGGEKADAVDDQAFAAAALDRLRATDRPWVVVVDNCDSPPDTPGLLDLVPQPHAPGQAVIITTKDKGWLSYAGDVVPLDGLGAADLGDLELPPGLADAVDGRPLIGLALAALRDAGGVELPSSSMQGGPELVWDLLRQSAGVDQGELELARLLAWLPPEPISEQALVKISTWDASPGDTLKRLRFVTGATAAVAGLDSDGEAGDDGPRYRALRKSITADLDGGAAVGGNAGLLMHRLFAAAVRAQTWRDEPGGAADSIGRLLTTEEGRWLFITAADDQALARLESADTERAARALAGLPAEGRPVPGLLWHGLGHIRERRGPVRDSKAPFAAALATLDEDRYPYQVGESQIGVARVTYQNGAATEAELQEARIQTDQAQELLAGEETESRQLREQGNALSWLIEQRLTSREADLDRREARYAEVYRNLWLSFAERLRIARDLPAETPIDASAVPGLNDGLGPERAFFNLAGAAVQLAKAHQQLARRAAETVGLPLTANDQMLRRTATDLDHAERVYQTIRELREQRYGGRPHPHLAACLHGLAIVGHYRAALLDQLGELATAASHGAAALDQRLRIAGSLSGPDARATLRDPDVRKSADLLLKIMNDAVLARYTDSAQGTEAVAKISAEATSEWRSGPSRVPEEKLEDEPAVTFRGVQEAPRTGLVEARADAVRPRYLAASYPDVVRPRRKFGLEVSVALAPGTGRREAAIYGLDVPAAGKALLVTVHSPDLVVHGDHEQEIFVPANGDSAPVRFELEGLTPGVRRVRLRAWDGGSCVGEVIAEVTVDENARSRADGFSEGKMTTEPLRGEVTLEVTHHALYGDNRYGFRFRDTEMRYPEESRPLRYDPTVDAEALIERIHNIVESDQSRSQRYRALSQEGAQLWDNLVPEEVQRQFWECLGGIKQLTILSDNDIFPWELLYPGGSVEFLVTGDFPVTRTVEKWRWSRQLYKSPARFVVPGQPVDVPPAAEREARILREVLGATEPSISTLRELQQVIDEGGFGILHFACHAGFSRDDRGPKIILDQPFLPRELVRRRPTWDNPLVFLNACRSAGPRYRCYGLDGFAERFLRAGAGAFIGSLWEVGDSTALRFATELYRMMTDGKTLGDAITDLRGRVKNGDLTWLAYAVYGHPEARLV